MKSQAEVKEDNPEKEIESQMTVTVDICLINVPQITVIVDTCSINESHMMVIVLTCLINEPQMMVIGSVGLA